MRPLAIIRAMILSATLAGTDAVNTRISLLSMLICGAVRATRSPQRMFNSYFKTGQSFNDRYTQHASQILLKVCRNLATANRNFSRVQRAIRGKTMRWTCEEARDQYEQLQRRIAVIAQITLKANEEAETLQRQACELLGTYTLPYPSGGGFAE
jgi:hypothetical protein